MLLLSFVRLNVRQESQLKNGKAVPKGICVMDRFWLLVALCGVYTVFLPLFTPFFKTNKF